MDTQPKQMEKESEIIEETYVVDAPADATMQPIEVGESDLAEEPLPQEALPQAAGDSAQKAVSKEVKSETSTSATPATVGTDPEKEVVVIENVVVAEDVVMSPAAEGGEYYVQVGAFTDLENANKVLARLLSDGYKDSVLSKTETGLFRVQAGAFPDEVSAEGALTRLKTDYPEGFVFKKTSDE
ncbi:hypothetical protein GO013_12690 [Pseudodesulfovibrio sp. JC047]|nr:hypothetical protein [Pseudodesulfovibrio sp. JC047]